MSFIPPSSAIQISCRSLLLVIGVLFSALPCFAQKESPGRGTYPGGSYSLSDIEQINTTNGNVMFHIPVGSLPPGRNGLRATVAMHYNSKLWDSWFGTTTDSNGNVVDDVQQIYASPTGGWQYGYQYQLQLFYRPVTYPCSDPQGWYVFRLTMNFPDGSSHEFRPYNYDDFQGDGYYAVNPNGGGYGFNCSFATYTTGTMTYYSTDNTHLRLEIQHITSGTWMSNPWTLYLPDGGRVTANETGPGGAIIPQRIYDSNNNYIEVQNITLGNGHTANKIIDQLGRYILIEHNPSLGVDYVHSPGANNQTLTYTVTQKGINTYAWNSGYTVNSGTWSFGLPFIGGVDQITLPTQAGGYHYKFKYNIDSDTASLGLGEISSVTLPSAEQNKAQASYTYKFASGDISEVLRNSVTQKSVKYLKQYDNPSSYDNSANYITETTSYDVPHLDTDNTSTITAPDGGVTTEWFYNIPANDWKSGLVCKTETPNGTVVERIWQPNTPQSPYLIVDINPYVKTEFVSIRNAAGTLVKTAIKDYSYDKNGNMTQQVEYDWVSYGTVSRDGTGNPTGIPGGATVKRVIVNTFNSPTPDASDKTTVTSNAYNRPGSPNLRNAIASSKVLGSIGGAAVAYTEFTYDNSATTGNLTVQRKWDSTKASLSTGAPPLLSSSNSIAISNTYSTWSNGNTGKLTHTTDAKGNVTQYTYGNVGGSGTDVYPTQLIAAHSTSVARTTDLVYDLNSGLTLKSTDADNNVTTQATYDDLGRPTLVEEGGSGSPLVFLRETSTAYSAAQRRVIVRADKDTKADGKLISVQHYDQRGRLRLARTLESGAANDADDETLGIKVQTRYGYFSGNLYELASNPYRSSLSSGATNEPTMGWTLTKYDKANRVIEVKSFSGATLPTPFGSGTNSTGSVVSVYDGDKTTVADQDGKTRSSIVDGLGGLAQVIEDPTGLNYQTNYVYDALGNLLTVNQGAHIESEGDRQTRTFVYDSLSRLSSATMPEFSRPSPDTGYGTVNYTYDNNGNLLTKTDPRQLMTTYTYDQLNRPMTRVYSTQSGDESTQAAAAASQSVNYYYGDQSLPNGGPNGFSRGFASGRLVAVTYGGSGSLNGSFYGYDKAGRVINSMQVTSSDGTGQRIYPFSYEYFVSGNLKKQTYPSGRVVEQTYDDAGRLNLVKGTTGGSNAIFANSFQYSAHGAVEQYKQGNGLWAHTKFNSRLQVARIGVGISDSIETNEAVSTLRLLYSYGTTNNNGNVRSQEIKINATATPTVITQEYSYDGVNRLEWYKENSVVAQSYGYDAYGNRWVTSIPDPGLAPTAESHYTKATNRINLTPYPNVYYAYDHAGNITTMPQGNRAIEVL